MGDAPLVGALAEFAVASRDSELPRTVQDSVGRRLLDTIGICLAATSLDTSRAAIAFVEEKGGRAEATVISRSGQVPAAHAAFANGVLAHSLDYDDTHLPSILHPSATVIPAALAAGEAASASGEQLVGAVAAGLEICIRLGMAGYDPSSRNSLFFERGQHATSICGAIASAATATLLLGGDADDVSNAMGVAASMASGIIEANRTGGTVKRLHCGWAAQSGVTAAELTRHGFTGPPTVLEGRFGFYQAFLGGYHREEEILSGLGERWAVPDIHFKPYPSNHFTHTAIDAALAMREEGVDPDTIERITLGVAAPVIRTIGEPLALKQRPETGYQAQFSGPFVVAAALRGGRGLGLGLDDFSDEAARDPGLRDLMARVTVEADETCAEIYPDEFPCILTLETTSGKRFRKEILANRGGPRWPLTDAEIAVKFRDNAARTLTDESVSELEARIVAVRQARVSEVMVATTHGVDLASQLRSVGVAGGASDDDR